MHARMRLFPHETARLAWPLGGWRKGNATVHDEVMMLRFGL